MPISSKSAGVAHCSVRAPRFAASRIDILNFTIKKIPKAVLSRYEWGKDDYSLQVENLPKAPPPKGQMELIPADGDQTKLSQTTDGSDARPEAR